MTKQFITMFKSNFRRVLGLLALVFVSGSLTVGCYDDSELRASIDNLRTQLNQLQTLVNTLQNDDAVVSVTPNPDGSYTIKFKKSGDVTISNGKDGKDGQNGQDGSIVSVTKDETTYTFTFSDGTKVILPRYAEVRVLTFENADYKGTAGIDDYWSGLIDDTQYGGVLLYSKGCTWYDENNTFLSGSVLPYDPETWSGGFSGGGIAISDYASGLLEGADYTRQLEVYNPLVEGFVRGNSGNNSSDNFAIVYDAGEWASNPACLAMADGVARTIESVYVNNTSYVLNVLKNGNDYASKMAENGFFKVTATGYVGSEAVAKTDYYLAKNLSFVCEWAKWDLSRLGAVEKVVFSITGSPEQYGTWGFNSPAYLAIDDVAVRYYPE